MKAAFRQHITILRNPPHQRCPQVALIVICSGHLTQISDHYLAHENHTSDCITRLRLRTCMLRTSMHVTDIPLTNFEKSNDIQTSEIQNKKPSKNNRKDKTNQAHNTFRHDQNANRHQRTYEQKIWSQPSPPPTYRVRAHRNEKMHNVLRNMCSQRPTCGNPWRSPSSWRATGRSWNPLPGHVRYYVDNDPIM